MPRAYRPWAVLIALMAIGLAPALCPAEKPEVKRRPAAWAQKIERTGLSNLHKIADGLYRGAQPTAEGIKELEKLGVRTIVNLRSAHSDQSILGSSAIRVENVPTTPLSLDQEDVVRFLRIATDKKRQPLFVHCQHGADRTGAMCAAYRVVVQGWTKRQAIDEMTNGGFGFHSTWTNLPDFIEHLDVEKVKAELKRREGGTP
ncbi:MAG: dual specificity protein phosphatase family protein [Thermoguttaceae bacterium]